MVDRIIKIPGPAHPIDIQKAANSWRAVYKGQVIAESADVLVMQEAAYPPVAYFPRADVKMDLLVRTDHHTWCPYKGEASYFSIKTSTATPDIAEDNAVWTYEQPFDAVGRISERLAFYTTKLDAVEEI
ncbi:MAG: DUF427 domain-containing protein [Beijerinckiaceae bacterium]|nr:DUF427 domain-containing protein [Beijerinckiaceae bacterium]